MIDLKGFLTQQSFAEKIEEMVQGGMTYFDAIIDFADECNKSPEEMMPFMSPVLLDKVRKSASDTGLINLKETTLDTFFG